jgi:hypothetical protein
MGVLKVSNASEFKKHISAGGGVRHPSKELHEDIDHEQRRRFL